MLAQIGFQEEESFERVPFSWEWIDFSGSDTDDRNDVMLLAERVG